MAKLDLFLVLTLLLTASCNFGSGTQNSAERKTPDNTSRTSPNKANAEASPQAPAIGAGQATPDKSTATAECQKVDTGAYTVLKNQTFAIDFEPFRGSCFVTSHNPEYDEPPLESEFAIYKDGKRVFEFPHQFNGVNFGCWIEAVSFQDLNADSRTDIIVISKCSARSAPYNENAVYTNTGSGFTTNIDANFKLSDLKTVKDVAAFVRENRLLFFK